MILPIGTVPSKPLARLRGHFGSFLRGSQRSLRIPVGSSSSHSLPFGEEEVGKLPLIRQREWREAVRLILPLAQHCARTQGKRLYGLLPLVGQ